MNIQLNDDEFERFLEILKPAVLQPRNQQLPIVNYSSSSVAHEISKIRNGDKIAAIKIFRACTGSSLFDAKHEIEKYW